MEVNTSSTASSQLPSNTVSGVALPIPGSTSPKKYSADCKDICGFCAKRNPQKAVNSIE